VNPSRLYSSAGSMGTDLVIEVKKKWKECRVRGLARFAGRPSWYGPCKKKRDRRCVCTHTRPRAKKASRSSHTADHQLALLGLTYVHALSSTRANSCAESPADLIKQLIFAGLRTQTQMPWSPLPRLQAAEFCKVGSCGFSQSEV
jgi:hypothetical protein